MKIIVPEKLKNLAELLPFSLYVVGGYVRNALLCGELSEDIDIAGACTFEELFHFADKIGFKKIAYYKTTGTGVLSDGEHKYEFAQFRREKYSTGGEHTPLFTEKTDDIKEDALRRDFKCNAIYYDIKEDEIVDPLGGVADITAKRLDTATTPKVVFSRDGLRLMRLARISAEIGFTPTKETIAGAKSFAKNMKDISAERIYTELNKILVADTKYNFSPKNAQYLGLKILDETAVLDEIIPDLTMGRGMPQRSDFHKYDVLEHSLRTVLYADSDIRLSALLHDIGKPYTMQKYGVYHGHADIGEKIAKRVFTQLKADKKTIKETTFLIKEHMLDIDCSASEKKIRRFIVKNYSHIDKLLRLKQADFMAGLDKIEICPTVIKWQKIIEKMQKDGTPIKQGDLQISAEKLIEFGYKGEEIGRELKKLTLLCVDNPKRNTKEDLEKKAQKDIEKAHTKSN